MSLIYWKCAVQSLVEWFLQQANLGYQMNLSISEKIMNVNISFHFIFTRHSNISHGCHFVMTITILRYDADHSGALDRQEMYCLMVSIFYMVKADGVSTKVPNYKSTIKLKVPHFFKCCGCSFWVATFKSILNYQQILLQYLDSLTFMKILSKIKYHLAFGTSVLWYIDV